MAARNPSKSWPPVSAHATYRLRPRLDRPSEPGQPARRAAGRQVQNHLPREGVRQDVRGRPELERAIDQLGVLAEWDRATRSMMDGIAIMQRVHARGAAIKVLDKPHLDLTTAIGKDFLAFLSALAEDERERIHKRASEGRQAARKAGRRFGRRPKLNATQQARARDLVSQGMGLRAVAAEMNVHHSTIARLR